MPRVYGYMDEETGVFTPVQQGAQYNPPRGQVAYSSAFGQQSQPRQQWQGQGYRANMGQPQYRQWQGNGYRVNVGQPRYAFAPRQNANGYAPRGYNTNMNYGPWYGQQSYATYPPYAPNQPRYEWMPNSSGGIVPVRMGEYQREQPVGYEMMYNSQGVPVQVPVYAPMNNSAMPVRAGVDLEGRPYASQATTPQQRATTRVRNMPQPIPTGVSSAVPAAPMFYNQPQPVSVSTNSVAATQQSQSNQDASISSFLKPVEEPNGVLDLVPSRDGGAPILRQIGVVTGLIPPETAYEQRLWDGSIMFAGDQQEWAKRLVRWLSGEAAENAPSENADAN